MTAGEELMVFLEMNGYNIAKYKKKQQLSKFKTGNISLMHKKTLEDFLLTYYQSENSEVLHINPLIYIDLWQKHKIEKEKVEIFDFYIIHPRIEADITLQSFIDDATIKEEIKRRILNEVIDKWVQDYKEYSKAIVSNINEWADEMIEDVEYYRIPTLFKTIGISVVFIILFLTYFSKITFFNMYQQEIMKTVWFNIYFIAIFTIAAIYIVKTDLFRKRVKNVKTSWKKQIVRQERKIDKQLDKFTFVFEDLIVNDELIKRRKVLKKLSSVETVNKGILRLKSCIFNFEKGFNKVLCNYETSLHFKDVSFFLILALFIVYMIMGFTLSKGWI
jgi:hypothetical protein